MLTIPCRRQLFSIDPRLSAAFRHRPANWTLAKSNKYACTSRTCGERFAFHTLLYRYSLSSSSSSRLCPTLSNCHSTLACFPVCSSVFIFVVVVRDITISLTYSGINFWSCLFRRYTRSSILKSRLILHSDERRFRKLQCVSCYINFIAKYFR